MDNNYSGNRSCERSGNVQSGLIDNKQGNEDFFGINRGGYPGQNMELVRNSNISSNNFQSIRNSSQAPQRNDGSTELIIQSFHSENNSRINNDRIIDNWTAAKPSSGINNNQRNYLTFNDNQYMFEFRTNQCIRFQDHKCPFHKPFNCFDWHFPNQRRRVPIKKPNGTFNYNPDLYCNTYDQSNGKCSNGQSCQYVHMNAGDTERRYHPRYFKTGMCIYETSNDGVCGKNGIHCAFAHNQNELRSPVMDIRESFSFTNNLSAQLEKERVLSEDPIWNDIEYVLAYYKTMECKKQPKTCRQGYACPFYHNSKDKRRILNMYSYQSQPCIYLKPNNDEWQDVAFCPNQDNCAFSHSRTEQQFHFEIFKSSKCNDMIKDNYCPRGPFCAFAHSEEEINNGQYKLRMDDGFLMKIQLMNFEKINISGNSHRLIFNESKSQINHVFQSNQTIPQSLSLPKPSEVDDSNTLKMFDESTCEYCPASSLSDCQTKDISKNLQHILERALSDSSNVHQMSDKEIESLPELLMKFSNGEELQQDTLPVIAEWINESDDSSFTTEIDKRDDSDTELIDIAITPQSINKHCESNLLNQEKVMLHKEILETKNKLIKVEEDLKMDRHQLKSIFGQLKTFLKWLEKSEINDIYKKEINTEISIIIENLGKLECLNDRLVE